MLLDLSDPETFHDDLQKWMVINTCCYTDLIPLMQRNVLLRLAEKPELAEKCCLHYGKAGVRAKTSNTSILSCQFSIVISGGAAHSLDQCSFHLSVQRG